MEPEPELEEPELEEPERPSPAREDETGPAAAAAAEGEEGEEEAHCALSCSSGTSATVVVAPDCGRLGVLLRTSPGTGDPIVAQLNSSRPNPAYIAGIEIGDFIVAVNGCPVAGQGEHAVVDVLQGVDMDAPVTLTIKKEPSTRAERDKAAAAAAARKSAPAAVQARRARDLRLQPAEELALIKTLEGQADQVAKQLREDGVDAFLDEVFREVAAAEAVETEVVAEQQVLAAVPTPAARSRDRTDEQSKVALRHWTLSQLSELEQLDASHMEAGEFEKFLQVVNLGGRRYHQLLAKIHAGTASDHDNIEIEKLSLALFPQEEAHAMVASTILESPPHPGSAPRGGGSMLSSAPPPAARTRSKFRTLAAAVSTEERLAAEEHVRDTLLTEIDKMDTNAQRELLRIARNASAHAKRGRSQRLMASYLKGLGAGQNEEFDVMIDSLRDANTFDLVLFRGTELVSHAIAKVSKRHGSDFFSHVGMVIKSPIVPRGGHYLRSGAIDATGELGNLPHVKLTLRLVSCHDPDGGVDWSAWQGTGAQPNAATLLVTVQRCVRLPDRVGDGGVKEDPYVRLVLEPDGDATGSQQNMESDHDGIRLGNPAQTRVVWNQGPSPYFRYEVKMPFVINSGRRSSDSSLARRLRVEVWDRDRLNPDDLVAEGYVSLESKLFLASLQTPRGKDIWARLERADSAWGTRSIRGKIRLPEPVGPTSTKRRKLFVGRKKDTKQHKDRTSQFVGIHGRLLLAPLGRQYAQLYEGENPHLGCRTNTYKRMFTWKYFIFWCLIVLWIATNYVLFFWFYERIFTDYTFHSWKTLVTGGGNYTDQSADSICASDGSCEWEKSLTLYMQLSDCTITAIYVTDLVIRLVCLNTIEFLMTPQHYLDLILVTCDVSFLVLQFQGVEMRLIEILRTVRILRLLWLRYAYRRIKVFHKRRWGLHNVTIRACEGHVLVHLGHVLSGEDRHARGPYIVDHTVDPRNFNVITGHFTPTEEAVPAKPLDRGEHIKYLRHQSEFCFIIPVVDSKHPDRRLYLTLDSTKRDVRDSWIGEINDMYRTTSKVQHRVSVDLATDIGDFARDFMHSNPRRASAEMLASGSLISGVERVMAGAFRDVMSELLDGEMTHVPQISSEAKYKSVNPQATSRAVRADFELNEVDEFGEAVPYLWESSASGRIAGIYRASAVLDEETGRGTLGVQVRNLKAAVEDFEGEACLLKFQATWNGEPIDLDDPDEQDWLRHELTRIHELYYRRSYTCNCFLCLATVFPRYTACAKSVSRLCECICCDQIKAFREDGVKCSQLVANIYQAVGFMDPQINPSEVLPVDFLPAELRDLEHSLGAPAIHLVKKANEAKLKSVTEIQAVDEFNQGFPNFDVDLVPLKVRKDYSGFYQLERENAESTKKKWTNKKKAKIEWANLRMANKMGALNVQLHHQHEHAGRSQP